MYSAASVVAYPYFLLHENNDDYDDDDDQSSDVKPVIVKYRN